MIKRIGTLAVMVGVALPVLVDTQGRAVETTDFEVWAVDQSGTGGRLYIYDGESLIADPAGVRPSEIDLNDAVTTLCQQQTGSAPTRGHMLAFNSSETHAILAYVATGHVVFLDARTRAPLTCIDVGAQAHAALPAPNDRYVIVANQNSNNVVGSMPGLAVISVDDVGLRGRLVGLSPIVNRAPAGFDCPTRGDDTPGSVTNQADPHGIALRLKGCYGCDGRDCISICPTPPGRDSPDGLEQGCPRCRDRHPDGVDNLPPQRRTQS